MYLRKHVAIGISLIMAMASISGCGGAKGGNGAPQNKETQGKETQDKGAQDKGGQDKAAQGKDDQAGTSAAQAQSGESKVITENEQFITGYKNSILTTIPAVLILMTATSMAAYVLARFNGRFYRSVYMIFVSGILIPIQCIMLPLYLNFFRLGLTNSNLGFVIARTGLQIPISILVVTGFVKTVPLDLEEAARIDGCNRFTMFWKIVFPLMKPVNATQLVLNTLFIWNDYTTAVILLRKVESRTLLLAQMAYFNEYTSELNLAFAFFILAMLPILILYFCMQKYVVSGIMMGAVKGLSLIHI